MQLPSSAVVKFLSLKGSDAFAQLQSTIDGKGSPTQRCWLAQKGADRTSVKVRTPASKFYALLARQTAHALSCLSQRIRC